MLFVPIWDLNPLKVVKFQYVTVSLIAINAIVYFVFETNLIVHVPAGFIDGLALKPSDVVPLDSFVRHMPEQFRLFTYMFLHGSFLHLLFNMIFLFVFGDNVEDAMGHLRFIVFYLTCGAIAALAHSLITTSPDLPLIGASGAVSGVIGAYLMLHPNVRVWVLLPLPNFPFLPLRFSAGFVIGVWIVYQIGSAIYSSSQATAWWAHVGGFFTGALLVTVMKRPDVRLFDTATGV
ncbi:MAG: rhomboid family intramembrane serine protease [Rhodomicrobium sp.]